METRVTFPILFCACLSLHADNVTVAPTSDPADVFIQSIQDQSIDFIDACDCARAAEVKKSQGMEMPWLVEDEAQTLSTLLMINSIPQMALIAPDGRLLWSGHPMDDGLIVALAKLGVALETD